MYKIIFICYKYDEFIVIKNLILLKKNKIFIKFS